MKLLTIVGTRPELIKLSRLIPQLDVTPGIEHVLVHTGQNSDYELNEIFFDEMGMRKPNHSLRCGGGRAAMQIGQVIQQTDLVLISEKPDGIVILGDTNSSLAVIPAKRRGIPVFHLEAGNRCFSDKSPEEINRRIVDHTSDWNLCYTENARRNLLAEGIQAPRIVVTGSPMTEVLEHYREQIDNAPLPGIGHPVADFFLVSCHRQENVDSEERRACIYALLQRLENEFKIPIVVSVHPRLRQHLNETRTRELSLSKFAPPFGFFSYVKLQRSAFCVLSDSGTLPEEAAILGFPAVGLREYHERPEAEDAGIVTYAALDEERVVRAIHFQRSICQRNKNREIYSPHRFSTIVINTILSHLA